MRRWVSCLVWGCVHREQANAVCCFAVVAATSASREQSHKKRRKKKVETNKFRGTHHQRDRKSGGGVGFGYMKVFFFVLSRGRPTSLLARLLLLLVAHRQNGLASIIPAFFGCPPFLPFFFSVRSSSLTWLESHVFFTPTET